MLLDGKLGVTGGLVGNVGAGDGVGRVGAGVGVGRVGVGIETGSEGCCGELPPRNKLTAVVINGYLPS